MYPHCLGSFEIYYQIEFCWLLDWKIRRIRASKNSIYITRCAAEEIHFIRTIGDKPTIGCDAELLKRLLKYADALADINIAFGDCKQHADPPHLVWLLRARGKRPSCGHHCTAKRSDELAPPHEALSSEALQNAGPPPANQDVFEIAILCLPKAPGCQLLEAATSVGGRFPGSSQTSNALDRAWTLY